MKSKVLASLTGLLVLSVALLGTAHAETFTINANVPASTGASFAVSKVTGGEFTPQASNNLNFGELTLFPELGVFLAPFYYAIDVGGTGGAGIPNISVEYTDTGAPTGAVANLGDRGTFSYASVVQSGSGDIVTAKDGMSLSQANGLVIDSTDLDGGFLRISVGTATGDPVLEEGDAVPFNLGDAPGNYTGTLTLTAVVL